MRINNGNGWVDMGPQFVSSVARRRDGLLRTDEESHVWVNDPTGNDACRNVEGLARFLEETIFVSAVMAK